MTTLQRTAAPSKYRQWGRSPAIEYSSPKLMKISRSMLMDLMICN